MTVGTLRFGRVNVTTSNEDKVLFPADGITKGDLIRYHRDVAAAMLPHLKGRPLSFQRYPNGIQKPGFFQKDTPKHYPKWITRISVRKKGGRNHHVVADKTATLAYLANNGVITLHGALSAGAHLDKPDRLIFDLDPSIDDFSLVRYGAETVREVLEDLGLPCFLQTTGSRGLHVVTPLRAVEPFDSVGTFARKVAEVIVGRDPDAFTIERLKEDRGDRLLIDYFRNAHAQTVVVPYSVRARPTAPVATPIDWRELDNLSEGAATYTIHSVIERLRGRRDPWSGITRRARTLDRARERLERRG